MIRRILQWPKFILFCVVLITILTALKANHLSFDSSPEKILATDNPAFQTYLNFKADYQAGLAIVLLLEDENIFSVEFLQSLQLLQNDLLNEVPYISHVESLLTSRRVEGEADNLYFNTLVSDLTHEQAIATAKVAALNTPYYLNRIINKQANATAIILNMQPFIYSNESGTSRQILQPEMHEIITQVHHVIQRHQGNFKQTLRVGGPATATMEMMRASKTDLINLTAISLIVICLMLSVLFKRASAVFLPLIILICTITITLSLMMINDVPIQNVSAILPSFLLAVCICDAIHVLQAFYRYLDEGLDKNAAIIQAFEKTQQALFYTTITTAIGLLSFSVSSITAIAHFGLFGAIGVCIALILTLLCLPSLLILMPIKIRQTAVQRAKNTALIHRYLIWVQRHAKSITISAIIIAIGSAALSSQITFSHNTLSWLPENNPTRLAVEHIDEKLTGTMPLELLVDTGEEYGAFDPKFLSSLDNWLEQLQASPVAGIEIRASASLLNLLKEVHGVLNNAPEQTLATSRELIAQEILLIEIDAQEQLTSLANNNYQTLRISLATSWQDMVAYQGFVSQVTQSFQQHFSQSHPNAKLTLTGTIILGSEVITEMMNSMAQSYMFAGILVSLLIIILVRNLKLGMVMMLPNVLPIIILLGFMASQGLALDMFTLLVGAIAIGIIVDDSIHFIHGYQYAFKQTQDTFSAIEQTLFAEGRALVMTSVVLCAGFCVYFFSELHNIRLFGLLTSFCIVLALIADLLLAPAILFLINKKTSICSA